MKNRIASIIIVSAILLFFVAFKGIKIGKFEVLSISQIIEKNDFLNGKILKASTLTSIDYPNSIEKMEESFDTYSIKKQQYEELSAFATEEKSDIYETKQYDIGYLWKIFGDYAKTSNLTISMDVKKSSGNLYDLNFNVSGTYTNISKFIADLENNSDLYFRIYNFKMSGSGEIVSSLFTVKDVNINPSTITGIGISSSNN